MDPAAAPAPPAAAADRPAERPSGVLKDGWLYWGTKVGDLIMWKKRWSVLTLHKFCSFANHINMLEPIDVVLVASIEEMAFGKFLDKRYAFTVQVPTNSFDGGKISIATTTEEDREEWVKQLRTIVPKAKVELAKEILLRKTKKEASEKHTKQQIEAAIESIMRDSKRVAVLSGFKPYSDDLASCFQSLLQLVDRVPIVGAGVAKKDLFGQCAYKISILVDSANSTAAVCTNKALIDEIVVRTGDIAIEMANILGYAIRPQPHENLMPAIDSLRDQVQQILDLLFAAAKVQQELDAAKKDIEQLLPGIDRSGMERDPNFDVDAEVAALTEKARAVGEELKTLQQEAARNPSKVGQISRRAAQLMCELMDATSIVQYNAGLDDNGDLIQIEGHSGINEHTRQQLLSMMAAAKGFAAATTNVIDIIKQVPQNGDDEQVDVRLAAGFRSSENALAAFLAATSNFDSTPPPDYEPFDFDDPMFESAAETAELDAEQELLGALREIEDSIAKLSAEVQEKEKADEAELKRQQTGFSIPEDGSIAPVIMMAAKDMGLEIAQLVAAAAAAQKKLKMAEGGGQHASEDVDYSRGMIASAKAVAQATNFLMEIAMNPNSTVEEVVAAARCANAAKARLVAYARVKADLESAVAIDEAAKAITNTTKRLVGAAYEQKAVMDEGKLEAEMARVISLPVIRQRKVKIEAQERVGKLQVDLNSAHDELKRLRRAVYKDAAFIKFE